MSPVSTQRRWRLLGSLICAACLALAVASQDKSAAALASQTPEKQTQEASKPDPQSDTGISQCINDKLGKSSKLKDHSITVSVSNGEASLIGSVSSESRKRSASSLAKQCRAKTVNNALTVDLAAKTKGPKAKDIKPNEGEKKPPQR
jgi:osmotically-inducible protein OsmY